MRARDGQPKPAPARPEVASRHEQRLVRCVELHISYVHDPDDSEARIRAAEAFSLLLSRFGGNGVVAVAAAPEASELRQWVGEELAGRLLAEQRDPKVALAQRLADVDVPAPWAALVLRASPRFLLELTEDRRTAGLIYVPASAAELRHFQVAHPDAVAV